MRKFVLKGLTLLSIGAVPIWAASFWLSDLFTRGYVYFQIFVFLLVLGILSKKRGWHTHTNTAASILTIIGVFGTFIGIFVGLQSFDIKNIETSIPGLLEGLKLAFLTSLVGIGSALFFKCISLFQTTVDESGEAIDKLASSLAETLQSVETSGEINLRTQLVALNNTIETVGRDTITILHGIKSDLITINTSLTDGRNEAITHLQELKTTFSDKQDVLTSTVLEKHDALANLQEEEGRQTREELTSIQVTLTNGQKDICTQLENLTISFSDKQDSLITQFQEFSKNVAESVAKLATDELIDALKTVIEDFNAKITEQFGENFKQLNEAVGKTVEWQEQYRQQMDELADEFRLAAQSIEISRKSVESIAESSNDIVVRSNSIVDCAEKLDPILHTLNNQLEAFSELRQNALNAFPLIENQLTELTTGFSDAVQTAIDNSHKSMKQQHDALTEHSDLLKLTVVNTSNELKEFTTRFSESVETSIKSVETSINQAHNSMNLQRDVLSNQLSEIEELVGKVTQQVQETINTSQSSMNHQRQELVILTQQLQGNFREFEQTLEAELTKSLQNLTGHLTSLSEKFVEDYTPLTEELYRLVNLARSGPSR